MHAANTCAFAKSGIAAIIGLYFIHSPSLNAAEWYLEPSISGRVEYNDNLQMRSRDELSATEYAIKPNISLGRRTARSNLQGYLAYEPRRFTEDELNTNSSWINLNGYYGLTERQQINLSFSQIKDTTLESELEETGIIYDRAERNRISVNPGWSYAWSETTALNAAIGYTTVDYDESPNTGISDYDTGSATFSVAYRSSPATMWTLGLGATRYERDDGLVKSENTQLTLGLEHDYTQRLKFSASAGVRQTETEVQRGSLECPAGTTLVPFELIPVLGAPCIDVDTFTPTNFIVVTEPTTGDSTGALASLNTTYQLERGEIGIDISRTVSPSAISGLIVTDKVGVSLSHRFSETLTGRFHASWYQTQNTDDSNTQVDRTYFRVAPSLEWKLARDWRFAAQYRYMKQEREGALDSAAGNVVSLSLTYDWPPYTASR
ncbi:outer membrane beta-barrel protein [Thiohalobacter thiocyanaticus]|nr:outer membrane beta-barrel protein [Thiohalobacter thiocyanaticus]